MSWKPEIEADGKWYASALTFATQAEAAEWAESLFYRWTNTTGHRAVESDQPVTHEYVTDDRSLLKLARLVEAAR
jgi:hypothetical protein